MYAQLLEALLILTGGLLLLYGAVELRRYLKEKTFAPLNLKRHGSNPVLSPGRAESSWEEAAVFNPTAFFDGSRVHLFYRAVGHDGLSRVGYAASEDGKQFNYRLPYPVYELRDDIAKQQESAQRGPQLYHPGLYASGGGWGGAEDPRIVKIDNMIHMTFTAFMGWHAMRVALTSLRYDDLLKQRWLWRDIGFLSPPGKVAKKWVLFPETIGGKYAVLHSISPEIQIHYADSIDELYDEKSFIESRYERTEQDGWDTYLRGAGPPPVRTPEGWLLLYHAIDRREPDRYKVGAMLLDLERPERILYRAGEPLLAPDMDYENAGKPGVVYATGAVVLDDELIVYYGGGDTTINIATASLPRFMKALKGGGTFARLFT